MIPTTLVRIIDERVLGLQPCEVWTTLEGENPGGSIKDRMVFQELSEALYRGEIKSGDTVTEISAGSTALSLAYHARELGLRCLLFVPFTIDSTMKENILKLGAQVQLSDPKTAFAEYEIYCKIHPVWRLDQMKKPHLRKYYELWAQKEIRPKLPVVDMVISAVGTGLSLLGITAALKPLHGNASAEPNLAHLISGIRNLTLEDFGAQDPCDRSLITRRIELAPEEFFKDIHVKMETGLVRTSDSFRVSLGAFIKLRKIVPLQKVFIVGSHNRR